MTIVPLLTGRPCAMSFRTEVTSTCSWFDSEVQSERRSELEFPHEFESLTQVQVREPTYFLRTLSCAASETSRSRAVALA